MTPCNCSTCKAPETNAWRCEKTGVWYYRQVPEGMRQATEKDFLAGMRMRLGVRYLVKSFHTELYHAYKITRNTKYEELLEFIKANHVYVKQ